MKIVKISLVALCMLVVFCGCLRLNGFLCRPTASELSQAQNILVNGQTALTELETLSLTPEVKALIEGVKLAMKIAQKVVDGYCMTVEFPQAITTINQVVPATTKLKKTYELERQFKEGGLVTK